MGLDNYIVLRNKETKEDFEFVYFRKYFELDNWFREYRGFDYEFKITKNNLADLYDEISLNALYILNEPGGSRKLDDLNDRDCLPEDLKYKFYGYFNPVDSSSYAPFYKLEKLFFAVKSLLYWIEDNEFEDKYDIIFISSF